MKSFSLVLLLISLCISGTFAQKTVQVKKKNVGASTQAFLGTDGDTCLRKEFSIVFYGMQDSGMTRTSATFDKLTDSILLALNRKLVRICVSLKKCSTVIVPHYNFNEWDFGKTDQAAIRNWYTDKVINVYLPDFIVNGWSLEQKSYAYALGVRGAVQNSLDVVIVQTDTAFKKPPNTYTVAEYYARTIHAFGHYFGLPDTFSELGPPATPPPPAQAIISEEFADGSNSAINGDLFTDTEADPYPHEWWTPPYPKIVHCQYGLGTSDGKGRHYTPPVDNYMSLWPCRCRFTQQQYNHMARFILKNRLYLH